MNIKTKIKIVYWFDDIILVLSVIMILYGLYCSCINPNTIKPLVWSGVGIYFFHMEITNSFIDWGE